MPEIIFTFILLINKKAASKNLSEAALSISLFFMNQIIQLSM